MLELPISLADVGIHGAILHRSDGGKVLTDVDEHPQLGKPTAQLPADRTDPE